MLSSRLLNEYTKSSKIRVKCHKNIDATIAFLMLLNIDIDFKLWL
jgi:hypothetical protein